MKQSSLLIPETQTRLASKGEDPSQTFLVNTGFLGAFQEQQYVFLPLAMRVMEHIKAIAVEELEKLSAVEFQLPVQSSVLGEEYLTNFLLKEQGTGAVEMPLHVYQIQTALVPTTNKRSPFLTNLESTFLDVFSFHETSLSVQEGYHQFEKMFERILARCELEFQSVVALDENTQAKNTKELIALTALGDKTYVASTGGEYRAKLDVATRLRETKKSHATFLPTSEEPFTATTEVDGDDWLTYRLLRIGKQPLIVFYQKDDQLSLIKLRQFLNKKVMEVKKSETEKYFGQSLETLSLKNLPEDVLFIGDVEVENRTNMKVLSPNEATYYKNVNPLRDFTKAQYGDIVYVKEGDCAPDGTGALAFKKGMKIGKLYQKLINLDKETEGFNIGHYQLDLSRLFLMIAHQHSHESGILWPMEVAPFDVHLIPENLSDTYQAQLAEEVEEILTENEYQVLLDDRELALEDKVQEASFIGCPIVILIGKKAVEGVVELKISASQASIEVRKEELMDTLAILLQTTE